MVCALRERQTSVTVASSYPLRRTECAARPDRLHPALLGAKASTHRQTTTPTPPARADPRRTRQQGPPRARRNRVASVRSRPIVVGPVLRSWTNWLLLASKPFRIAYHFSRRTPGHYRGDKTGSSLFIDPQWSPRGRKIRSCSVGPCHPLPAVGADTNWPTRKQSVKALSWAGFG